MKILKKDFMIYLHITIYKYSCTSIFKNPVDYVKEFRNRKLVCFTKFNILIDSFKFNEPVHRK